MGKEANVNICLIDGIDNKKLVIICKKIYFYCCYIRTDEKVSAPVPVQNPPRCPVR